MSLQRHLIYLSRHTSVPGHSGKHHTKYIMRTGQDVYPTASAFYSCPEKGVLLLHGSLHKLFPATGLLELVVIYIFEPISMTTNGNRYIVVIMYRYFMLTRSASILKFTTINVTSVFFHDWTLPRNTPSIIPTDKSLQHDIKRSAVLCAYFLTKPLRTTPFPLRANRRVEQCEMNILECLRYYVFAHKQDWDPFRQPLSYKFRSDIPKFTNAMLFVVVFKRHPLGRKKIDGDSATNAGSYHYDHPPERETSSSLSNSETVCDKNE